MLKNKDRHLCLYVSCISCLHQTAWLRRHLFDFVGVKQWWKVVQEGSRGGKHLIHSLHFHINATLRLCAIFIWSIKSDWYELSQCIFEIVKDINNQGCMLESLKVKLLHISKNEGYNTYHLLTSAFQENK